MGFLDLASDAIRRAPPQPHLFFTNPQNAYMDSDYIITVWWGTNNCGKSDTTAEAITRAIEGSLHWQSGPGPRTVMAVGNTWDQLSTVLEGVAAGRAGGWFKDGIRFQAGRMQGQRSAIFDVVSGPGKGGKLICKTFSAGAKNIAGPRAEAIFSDEPLPEDIYNELWPRLFGRQGRLYITYTPTLGTSHKIDYLWKAVDDPDLPFVGEINTPLTLDAVTPRGGLIETPWSTQDEIDRFTAGLSPVERAMRTGYSRQPRMDTAYFGDLWGEELISTTSPPEGARVGIGIDHGSKPGAERVLLVAVSGYGLHSRVWVMDEWSGSAKAGAREVARAILDMLARNNLAIADVDYWVGDRAHGGDRKGGAISNSVLKQAFAELLGIDTNKSRWSEKLPPALQRLWPPRKYTNSDYEGMAMLRRLMMGETDEHGRRRPRITFAKHCTAIQSDVQEWQGSRTDPHKDGLDGLRYIVRALTDPPARMAA